MSVIGNARVNVEAGSFRDPSGTVYEADGDIYRTVSTSASEEFKAVWATGCLQGLIQKGWLVPAEVVQPAAERREFEKAGCVLQHPRLSFISYPYEWSFSALKSAALLHLDIQLEALTNNVALTDASAYNVQFSGHKPIFIDHLSFCRYREGDYWIAHSQFLDQFLNPLLLRALLGVPHNAWFRGNLEGISTADLNRLLPWHSKFSINVLTHVTLPARLQARFASRTDDAARSIKRSRLPRASYHGMLKALRQWICGLNPKKTGATTWQRYEDFRTYGSAELDAKRAFVADFVAAVTPKQLWDLGCNTGEFSELALHAGGKEVIGFDIDHGALELAFARARDKKLSFLPLFLDAANPSPSQGWACVERKALPARSRAEALLALAFVHHLVIARNVPLLPVLTWLTALAPQGVIEFVPKEDPTVQVMLQLRQDIFPDYDRRHFLDALSQCARVVKQLEITDSGRLLVWYQRQ